MELLTDVKNLWLILQMIYGVTEYISLFVIGKLWVILKYSWYFWIIILFFISAHLDHLD